MISVGYIHLTSVQLLTMNRILLAYSYLVYMHTFAQLQQLCRTRNAWTAMCSHFIRINLVSNGSLLS